jgi:hypothetical protein
VKFKVSAFFPFVLHRETVLARLLRENKEKIVEYQKEYYHKKRKPKQATSMRSAARDAPGCAGISGSARTWRSRCRG